ncbi:MAG: DUF2927 domain-containing protein [Pseudomonadota bacterium]
MRRGGRLSLLLIAALLLTGCDSIASGALTAIYSDDERFLLSDGRLRTASEAPTVDAETLARNYLRVAFQQEAGGGQRARAVRLLRWEGAVSYRVEGGGADPATRRAIDAYLARLAALSGLEIFDVGARRRPAALRILIIDEAERQALRDRLAERGDMETLDLLSVSPLDTPCYLEFFADARGVITRGRVIIRAEATGLLRQACIEEELAQTLGLLNDDPTVYPSIFNDDQEFATLTRHDEDLIRIHYDPRLRPGMTAADARPVVARIVQDLF